MSLRLVIMGPQGSGKGTQAERLSALYGMPAISTGDLFRAHVRAGTDLGNRARDLIDAGDLVPDSITGAMVRDRLREPDASHGFILDGYPRNAAQVTALDVALAERGAALDAVLELLVNKEELLGRLAKRALTEERTDDTSETIKRRLAIYAAQTRPLSQQYRERGLLTVVDGTGSVDEITDRLVAALLVRFGPQSTRSRPGEHRRPTHPEATGAPTPSPSRRVGA